MYLILDKKQMTANAARIDIKAPLVAKKAKPGQFVMLRAGEHSERMPFTIHDADVEQGSVAIVYQVVGAGTQELDQLKPGDSLQDFVGPLGQAVDTAGLEKVCVVGGGVGCAIAYPVAKALHDEGCELHSVIGFRNKDLVFLDQEFGAISDEMRVMTDDGSFGEKGLVTDALRGLIEAGHRYDRVITIGPLVMMKFVCLLTKEFGIPTEVSMNPIMVDGTGMCGGCRLTVAGKTKFACVDGPGFDGHEVDFDELISRNRIYEDFEMRKREENCRLLNQEVT